MISMRKSILVVLVSGIGFSQIMDYTSSDAYVPLSSTVSREELIETKHLIWGDGFPSDDVGINLALSNKVLTNCKFCIVMTCDESYSSKKESKEFEKAKLEVVCRMIKQEFIKRLRLVGNAEKRQGERKPYNSQFDITISLRPFMDDHLILYSMKIALRKDLYDLETSCATDCEIYGQNSVGICPPEALEGTLINTSKQLLESFTDRWQTALKYTKALNELVEEGKVKLSDYRNYRLFSSIGEPENPAVNDTPQNMQEQ